MAQLVNKCRAQTIATGHHLIAKLNGSASDAPSVWQNYSVRRDQIDIKQLTNLRRLLHKPAVVFSILFHLTGTSSLPSKISSLYSCISKARSSSRFCLNLSRYNSASGWQCALGTNTVDPKIKTIEKEILKTDYLPSRDRKNPYFSLGVCLMFCNKRCCVFNGIKPLGAESEFVILKQKSYIFALG